MQHPRKAELHCHTKRDLLFPSVPFIYESVMSVETILARAAALDISILAITDHDRMDAYYQAKKLIDKKKLPILLIQAVEVSTREGHVLAYGITEPIQKNLPLNQAVDAIHAQKGIAVAAHPYFGGYGVKDSVYKADFDAVEGYNSMTMGDVNIRAKKAAREIGIPAISASDAHHPSSMGTGVTWFKESVKTEEDLLKAIREGDFKTSEVRPNPFKMAFDHMFGHIPFVA